MYYQDIRSKARVSEIERHGTDLAFIGALMAQNDLGDDAAVATLFPDDNKKYLSTDLLRDEPVGASYLTPEVELLSYEAIKRVCYTCFDGED